MSDPHAPQSSGEQRPVSPPADAREPSDQSLLERFRHGNQDAATQLYRRYAQRLRELARAQSSADLAGVLEPDDIVQSVFGSFFRGARAGVYQLPDGEELWKLFLVIALNKIRARARYHKAARRDLTRTVAGASYDFTLETVASTDEAAESLLQLTMNDALDRLSPQHRQAIRLRIEGHEVAEIADAIGRSLRSTERLLQEARQHLADFLHSDEEPP
jgi:RNA polymerase sigma-70 factor (ECF subfamily)